MMTPGGSSWPGFSQSGMGGTMGAGMGRGHHWGHRGWGRGDDGPDGHGFGGWGSWGAPGGWMQQQMQAPGFKDAWQQWRQGDNDGGFKAFWQQWQQQQNPAPVGPPGLSGTSPGLSGAPPMAGPGATPGGSSWPGFSGLNF